jgi:glutamyl-tRNA synthetase
MAKKLIADGNGYMDDTDQETMQKERMDLKESKHRNTKPAENLALFDLLLKGDEAASKYCLRAKIDMSSVNGTMRDPVMFRFNDTPHHRTGAKYKAYPTYDFACPIVDAIEGVSHALRTTEYNDRDEQYHWIQRALGLRDVKIMTYGKINFVNTVLSKRKLNWFVEQGLVEGWFDPRFPTIQGCVRRGMNVEALKHFILSQGASRRVITMEWDKFWSENKKLLEEVCPRFMAVNDDQKVKIVIENVEDKVSGHTVQLHPQKPEHGTRVMRRGKYLWLDQIDAKMVKLGEDVTLLRWGNIKIKAIEMEAGSDVIHTIRADYDATATNFSKTKKLTWLAAVDDAVPMTIVEFDHLISKAKLGEEDNFKDYVNSKSRWEYTALGDPMIRSLAPGSVIQLERKGFFRVDKAYGGSSAKPAILFAIPDGKVQKPASK